MYRLNRAQSDFLYTIDRLPRKDIYKCTCVFVNELINAQGVFQFYVHVQC